MIKLAPSILSADFSALLEDVKKVEKAGCEYLHIDVMDGHFVPNITIGPPVVAALKGKTDMVFDVHLMIEKPERYLEAFAKAGADIITVHQEACTHLHRTLQQIRALGKKAGVSLNPATPIESIRHVLDELDMVLIMTVNPGFGGQKFISSMIPKIRELKKQIELSKASVDIQVDGGITPDNAAQVAAAGANILVAGSAIFGSGDIEERVRSFRERTAEIR